MENFDLKNYNSFMYTIIKTYSRKNKIYEDTQRLFTNFYKRPLDLLNGYLEENCLINQNTIVRYVFNGVLFCVVSFHLGVNYYVVVTPSKDKKVEEHSNTFYSEVK